MNLSLSKRVIMLILTTSAILVGAMLLTVYQLKVADYESAVIERNQVELNRLSTELELTQQQRLLGLEAFAARLLTDKGELLSAEAIEQLLLQPSVAKNIFPDGLVVFDASATAIAESSYAEGRLGTNYADRAHFQRAKKTRSSVISEPILGRVTGLPLLSYLQPILSTEGNGDILGYAGGILDLANTPLLNEDKYSDSEPTAITLIIDPRHRLFVSMRERFDTPQALPEAGTNPLVDAALALAPAGTMVDYESKPHLIVSLQLSAPDWIVLRALPYSDAIAPAQASFQQFIITTLIITILVAAVGARLAQSLTLPIERITKRIDLMADRRSIDETFIEAGASEVKALARAMNRMVMELNAANLATRNTERFLSNVLDSATEFSIIATDTQGVIIAFNRGAEIMLGYKASELVGQQTPAVLHLAREIEERSIELSQELERPIQGFRVFIEKPELQGAEKREWTYLHKDGHTIPVSLVVTTMCDDDGVITGYLGIAEDITERKRLDNMKSEFISTVSHELRTPLTSITGALGLLVSGSFGELPEKARKLLMTAHRNSKRLSALINDLLDIEKIAAGKLHLDMEVQPLLPLLEQAIEANCHYGSDRGVRLSLTNAAPDARVRVDSQRLMQVLANLLSNAVKFSPDEGEVRLTAEASEDRVIVSVIDKGPGIADSFHNRIFQRFSQADSSDTRAQSGTGLGLAISRELIEQMGGAIDFESSEGQGSRFFFELPLAQATTAPITTCGHAPRLLVVEDDPDVANLLSMILNEAGYQVDTVYNGTDALHNLQQTHYDLISLDLMLPDISGLEIIRLLRAQPETAELPILVVSAKMEEGRLAINGEHSNIDWMAKPINQQRLLDLIDQHLSGQREHRLRILHVEDDIDLHHVVSAMIGGQAEFAIAHTLKDARAAIQQNDFDVVLLDIGLPDGSGWDLIPEVKTQHPKARIIILSGEYLTAQQHEMVEAALLKSRITTEQLIESVGAHISKRRPNTQSN